MAYLLYCEKTDSVKAAAAKILDSDIWSFNWMKKERDSSSDDDESFTDEKRPVSASSPVVVSLPAIAHRAPMHSRTTSFDAPWLESSPRQSSFHPFTEEEAPPTSGRFAFLNRWWGH